MDRKRLADAIEATRVLCDAMGTRDAAGTWTKNPAVTHEAHSVAHLHAGILHCLWMDHPGTVEVLRDCLAIADAQESVEATDEPTKAKG